MKAYTDLEQSKKLAEILPIESADMWWAERYEGRVLENGQYVVNDTPYYYLSIVQPSINNFSQDTVKDVPCWSLAALLDYLSANFRVTIKYLDNYWELDCRVQIMYSKELVDACYEMIIELNKRKFL